MLGTKGRFLGTSQGVEGVKKRHRTVSLCLIELTGHWTGQRKGDVRTRVRSRNFSISPTTGFVTFFDRDRDLVYGTWEHLRYGTGGTKPIWVHLVERE